jgi:pimeloyl-ACP methyl ester carboxylesterase
MLAYDLAHALPRLTQPTLVLNPDDDLKALTPRVDAHLKNGRLHGLPGWTHGFLESKAAETAGIVRRFLDEK